MNEFIPVEDREHYVYHCLDASNRIIYIGMTCDMDARFRQHKYGSPWIGDMDEVVVASTHPNRAAARLAESLDISKHKPIHNQVSLNYYCKIDGCTERAIGRAMCTSHWYRDRMYGDPLGGPPWMVGGYSSPEVVENVDHLTYRQLDYWCRVGYMRPGACDASGSGSRRRFTQTDVDTLRAVAMVNEWVRSGSLFTMIQNGEIDFTLTTNAAAEPTEVAA